MEDGEGQEGYATAPIYDEFLAFGLKFGWDITQVMCMPSRHRERIAIKLLEHMKEEKRKTDAAIAKSKSGK